MKNIKNTTKYIQVIKIVLIAMVFSITLTNIAFAETSWEADNSWDNSNDGVWADNSWDNNGNEVWADNSWDNSNDGVWADNSWSNTTDGTWADNSWSGGSDYVETTTEYTYNQPGYSYGYYGGSYYPTRSNYVGVGYVATPGYTIPNQVSPIQATPNYVYNGFTGVNPTYTQPTYYPQYVQYPQTVSVVPNQVLSYQDTNSSLDSVYLSDVPYTGFSDYYGLIIFISILLSWSAVLAYMFLKRKIAEKTLFASVYTNTDRQDMDASVNSGFVNQIVSDKADIREVEEYARMKKVLLSTDAASKLVRVQRLGEGNAKSIIDNLSKNEWVAVGEKDL